MQLDGKVLLGRLYERTSRKGHRYSSGRLGPSRVMAFKDEYAAGDKSPQVAQEREGPA